MSTYEFYEFHTIDKPLSNDQMADISALSSRVDLNQNRAIFVYNYGSFPADPEEILLKYFDAMLYMANWGTKQLMFRFPETLLNIDEINRYYYDDKISLTIEDGYALINIYFYDEEYSEWMEGEGWLSSFLSLRQDILKEDYRVLFLAWLGTISYIESEGFDIDDISPPVPPGLKNLSDSLKKFAEFIDVDNFLIRASSEFSPELHPISIDSIKNALSGLSRDECQNFLLRLALNEPHLSIKLNQRLQAFQQEKPGDFLKNSKQLSIPELIKNAKELEKLDTFKQKEIENAKKKEELRILAIKEPHLWQEVYRLIALKKINAYDKAINILLKLKGLWISKQNLEEFNIKINLIHEKYSRLSALKSKLKMAGLIDKV